MIRSAPLPVTLAAFLSLSACADARDFNDARPNGRGQSPAFAGQTRAPVLEDGVRLRREVVAEGLSHPWGMAALPEGGWLVTERPGRLRIVSAEGALSEPVAGLPQVDARRQGGLLDVAIRGDFAQSRRVWWSYAEPRGAGTTGTAVASGRLSADGRQMEDVQVVFRQDPAWASTAHYGGRLVFDPSGALFVTTGERSVSGARELAQDVSIQLGKVIRIDPMGGPAPGNPRIADGAPGVWSWGHRNLQAAAIGPDGALWTVEHGPRGGDELNRPEAGKNYGWPVISYGVSYNGSAVGSGETARDGMEQPVYYWDPVIAPSGLAFYDGAMFPGWQGDALIGGLAGQALVRLEIADGRVTGEQRYLQGFARIRDVEIAPDGAVMILTDEDNGALIRLTPQ
ncbi:PQQ-dependent sugar dehydrogenase [Poseidonocella sp. HB161398]|uniref:PQQ-dependent sugar dehydrogenase n=1 Tax=Poseidonocella sp. HB161398 TaxID=2320855 RepID=UPI0011094D29|nr:PQQ-dependent sugar dehydrogenase [Poseidonocella sp. HB161398]